MQHEQDRVTLQDELELAFKVHSSTPNGSTSMAAADQEESQLQSRSDHEGSESHPLLVIAMGVSGCGKSTLGRAIAEALHLPFVDGDSLHPPSNIDKMSAGIPLTDEDRKPWLELIRNRAEHFAAEQQHHWHHALTGSGGRDESIANETKSGKKQLHGLVVACSSLKRRYRAILRGHEEPDASALPEGVQPPHPDVLPTFFVYIKGEREELLKRMSERKGHFMKTEMLDSQLETLESPEGEKGVVTVRLEDETDQQVANAVQGLKDSIGAEFYISS